MEHLTVYNPVAQKTRFGSSGDGGYVIIDGLTYDSIISGGVSNNIDFEIEFVNTYNVPCFAYDGTVPCLPKSHEKVTFIRKNIGIEDTDNITTLRDIIGRYDQIFMKMDIETFEYRWLEILTKEELNKIKQLVIEFHFPFTPYPFNHLDINIPVTRKMDIFRKLSETHNLVHFHGNNCCGTTTYMGVTAPNVFECTYVRKDSCEIEGLNMTPVPGPLDRPNVGGADIHLSWPPFVHSE